MKIRHVFQHYGSPYLIALLGILLATGIRYKLGPVLGGTIPVVIYTVPVLLSALYGGFWPGLFCTLISALISTYLFIEPLYSLELNTPASAIVLVVFLIIGLTISFFGERMQRLQLRLLRQSQRLEQANRELELANTRKDEFLAMRSCSTSACPLRTAGSYAGK